MDGRWVQPSRANESRGSPGSRESGNGGDPEGHGQQSQEQSSPGPSSSWLQQSGSKEDADVLALVLYPSLT